MQIMVDKVETAPFHALNRQDLQALLKAVPPEWLKYVSNIRLSATLNTSPARYVTLDILKKRLTVCSRYLTADRTRQEILRALASHTLGWIR